MKKIKNLDKKIVEILKSTKYPISTRVIALKTKRAWHTVLKNCIKMKKEGKLNDFKAGRMHLWSLNKK